MDSMGAGFAAGMSKGSEAQARSQGLKDWHKIFQTDEALAAQQEEADENRAFQQRLVNQQEEANLTIENLRLAAGDRDREAQSLRDVLDYSGQYLDDMPYLAQIEWSESIGAVDYSDPMTGRTAGLVAAGIKANAKKGLVTDPLVARGLIDQVYNADYGAYIDPASVESAATFIASTMTDWTEQQRKDYVANTMAFNDTRLEQNAEVQGETRAQLYISTQQANADVAETHASTAQKGASALESVATAESITAETAREEERKGLNLNLLQGEVYRDGVLNASWMKHVDALVRLDVANADSAEAAADIAGQTIEAAVGRAFAETRTAEGTANLTEAEVRFGVATEASRIAVANMDPQHKISTIDSLRAQSAHYRQLTLTERENTEGMKLSNEAQKKENWSLQMGLIDTVLASGDETLIQSLLPDILLNLDVAEGDIPSIIESYRGEIRKGKTHAEALRKLELETGQAQARKDNAAAGLNEKQTELADDYLALQQQEVAGNLAIGQQNANTAGYNAETNRREQVSRENEWRSRLSFDQTKLAYSNITPAATPASFSRTWGELKSDGYMGPADFAEEMAGLDSGISDLNALVQYFSGSLSLEGTDVTQAELDEALDDMTIRGDSTRFDAIAPKLSSIVFDGEMATRFGSEEGVGLTAGQVIKQSVGAMVADRKQAESTITQLVNGFLERNIIPTIDDLGIAGNPIAIAAYNEVLKGKNLAVGLTEDQIETFAAEGAIISSGGQLSGTNFIDKTQAATDVNMEILSMLYTQEPGSFTSVIDSGYIFDSLKRTHAEELKVLGVAETADLVATINELAAGRDSRMNMIQSGLNTATRMTGVQLDINTDTGRETAKQLLTSQAANFTNWEALFRNEVIPSVQGPMNRFQYQDAQETAVNILAQVFATQSIDEIFTNPELIQAGVVPVVGGEGAEINIEAMGDWLLNMSNQTHGAAINLDAYDDLF